MQQTKFCAGGVISTGSGLPLQQPHQIKLRAYAMLILQHQEIPLTTKEAYLGRNPITTKITEASQTSRVHVTISESSRVSRTACRIYLDTETDLFSLENLSKNSILVDRQPLGKGQSKPLFHKSLVQVGDCLFFFMLPNETQEKKKRFLKEKRKQLLD